MAKEVKKEIEDLDFDKEIPIKLKYPVEHNGETISEIVLQPLVGRHVRGIAANAGIDDLIRVASKASGVSEKVFDKMRTKDLMEITRIVGEAL